MPTGICKVLKQGQRGMFAQVIIEVETITGSRSVIIKPESEHFSSPKFLQTACEFGIYYAYNKIAYALNRGVVVNVIRFDWMPIDTKIMPVVYVSAHAVWDALKDESFKHESAKRDGVNHDADHILQCNEKDFSFTFFDN